MNHFKLLKNATIVFRVLIVGVLLFNGILVSNITVNAAPKEIKSISPDNSNLIQGKRLFMKARKMFYNAEAPFSAVKDALNSGRESFNNLPDNYEKYYWLAQIEFVMAEMVEVSGDKHQAAKGFTESGNLVRKALEVDPNFSESKRLLADTIMRLMSYNGAMYMMTQGPHALTLLNNALDLDRQNYTAMNSLGTYYLNAPAIGGGSVDKGIRTLQKALESKDEFDNFISNVYLGQAYQKRKNYSEAVKYYNKALEIYPTSPWAKGFLKEIEKTSK